MTKPGVTAPQDGRRDPLVVAAPALFVLLWSTGFIGAKYGMPYAEPFTFLLLRFAIVVPVFLAIALAFRAPWPHTKSQIISGCIVGVLIHGCYLGGIFKAISLGLPAGVAALIAGTQPLVTALAAGPLLGDRLKRRQWAGIALGLIGVALVVAEKLTIGWTDLAGVGLCTIAVLGITFGTLYQKRHGGQIDMRSGAVVQFSAAGVVMLVLAFLFEDMRVSWTGEFIFALGWLVLVLSVGAVSLLYLLIRRGAAAKVASLFYLVPPVTALIAFLIFGERLGPTAIAGMVIAVAGVALVTKG